MLKKAPESILTPETPYNTGTEESVKNLCPVQELSVTEYVGGFKGYEEVPV